MNKFLLLPILALLCLSCSNKYKVEGSASDAGLDGRMLFIKVLDSNHIWRNIDSCEVIHGEFSMKGTADSVMMATLFMDDYAILPLVVEEGTLKIKVNGTETKVCGTPLNDSLYDFLEKHRNIESKINELYHKESQMIINGENPDVAHDMVERKEIQLSKDMSNLIVTFITNNFENVLSQGVFSIMVSNMPYPVITPEIKEIIDKAPVSFKDYFIVREYMEAAEQNMEALRTDRASY